MMSPLFKNAPCRLCLWWNEKISTLYSLFFQPEISLEETGDADSSVSICITAITDANKRGQLGRCCLYFTPEKFSQIATVAWMILFGDAFHNFMDGMTIGVGFTESPSIGIALCLSILFEELPHELGLSSYIIITFQ